MKKHLKKIQKILKESKYKFTKSEIENCLKAKPIDKNMCIGTYKIKNLITYLDENNIGIYIFGNGEIHFQF